MMPRLEQFVVLSICLSLSSISFGANIYVDRTIPQNIADGTYSGIPGNGDAYQTIQEAINVMQPGDTVYMRGGTYNEHIVIPANKQGDSVNWFTVTSYPGEWAIVDGAHTGGTIFLSPSRSYNSCPQYWKFSRFEVTGSGALPNGSSAGSGFSLDTARYITFEYLYIHDNYTDSGSAGGTGGISIPNDDGGPQHILVRYCFFKNNGYEPNSNSAHITFFSDYVENPQNVNISKAMSYNEIAYNLIIGGHYSIKHKNFQWLSKEIDGSDITYRDRGDKIHHNIIIDSPMFVGQDFLQIYKNIFVTSENKSVGSVSIGSTTESDRHPFYVSLYNNLFFHTNASLFHDDDDSLDGSSYTIRTPFHFVGTDRFHPHFYVYNNIFYNIGAEMSNRNDLNILWDEASRWTIIDIDMSTVIIENNLFAPKGSTEEIINVGDRISGDFSATGTQFYEGLYASIVYTNTMTTGLFLDNKPYRISSDYVLRGLVTISNGGIGGSHPYLEGVTLPQYLGPTDPSKPDSAKNWRPGSFDADDAGWIDFILYVVATPDTVSNLSIIGIASQ